MSAFAWPSAVVVIAVLLLLIFKTQIGRLIDRTRSVGILALADEIDGRCPLGRASPIECRVGRHVTVAVPSLPSWLVKDLDKRFERAFGRSLVVKY